MPILRTIILLGALLVPACGGDEATPSCQMACRNLYVCLPDTTTPEAECVRKCETDAGKGSPSNRSCIAKAICDDLKHGKCPDLIVR